jgi:DNA primase
MDVARFLRDYRVIHSTEHKNIRDGWIGILDCPFCGTGGKYHLGYNTYEDYWSCWSCGGHSATNVVSKLTGVNYDTAQSIVKKYGGKTKKKQERRIRVGTDNFKLPSGVGPLQDYHKRYLEDRGFNWEYLEEVWRIHGTGPISKLDELSYKMRILAPIYWDQKLVSYQARDITEKHKAKYMACRPEREIISHKHVLYGIQEEWGPRGICVEGITDAWRLGTDAFATFGIKYTPYQIEAMAKHFREVVILYDPEEQAQIQADRMIKDLEGFNVKAWKVDLKSDPGAMDQDEANELLSQLLN